MFNNCRATSINLAGIDTSQVIAMDSMFKGYCGEIFGLHSLNTKNVCQYDSMFVSCQTPVIECSAFDIPVSKNGALVSTLYMFSWCDTEVISLNGVDCSRLASNAFMNTTVDTIYAKSDKDVKEIGWRLSGSEHKKTVRFIVNTIPEIGTVLIDDSGIEYRYGLHWDGLTWSTPKTPLNAWSAKTTSHNLAGIPNQIDGLAVVS